MPRRRVRVRGQVQGVGYRPFVYREAVDYRLTGWVCNDAQGVLVEAQGVAAALDAFTSRLRSACPPLARVASLTVDNVPEVRDESSFNIAESRAGRAATGITADAAVCDDCLAELFEPADRRYRYPFINCTHCGPRYTITGALPYDRPKTSMAGFTMCDSCRGEFGDPRHRRFHAQPNACGKCGPHLRLWDGDGAEQGADDPIAGAVARLKDGDTVAVKGLGGFHLVCDARNEEAVARLRRRKHREEKPLAIMAANAASLASLVSVSRAERVLLEGSERPIVLLRKRGDPLPGVAPGIAWLGAMLPYTPVHYLLFHEAAARPAGTAWLDEPQRLLLVMTSANPPGEPLVVDNKEAVRRLRGFADAFLVHDRDILVRCDDSVARAAPDGRPRFIRRARGYTPRAVKLPAAGPPVLAVGGLFKNTVCLTRGDEAFMSQHLGDMDNPECCRTLEATVDHLTGILRIEPEVIAHDLHPDFHGTRFALERGRRKGLPVLGVQHHHAHVAAVMAEHGLQGPVVGLALDGTGLGADGNPWGGELLVTDGGGFHRRGHLRELPLPGGDRAAREPWRMGAAVLHLLGREELIERRWPSPAAGPVRQMLRRGVNAPLTSSAGRWFDAAAGLLGVREVSSFEGQAAMLLEGLAETHGACAPDENGYTLTDGVLDLMPLMARLTEVRDPYFGAALFHATLVRGLAALAEREARVEGIGRVVLSGGCFLNDILRRGLRSRLEEQGLTVYEAEQVPANDGGISLGQAWVAAASVTGQGSL